VVTERSAYLLKLHKFWSQGKLAIAGGVMDQPSVYIDAMELLDVRLNKIILERERERARLGSKRDGQRVSK